MNTANWIFRFVVCELSKEEVAEITGRTIRTVSYWDAGKPIPAESKAKMLANAKRRPLSNHESWSGWYTRGPHLVTDSGEVYEAHEIKTAIWLLQEMRRDGRPPSSQEWMRRSRRR